MSDTTEKTFNQKAGETIMALAEAVKNAPDNFSRFEKSFIADTAARVEKFGAENTFFSERQSALVQQIHTERTVDGKKPGDK